MSIALSGGDLKPREGRSLAQGHTARRGRTKSPTQGPTGYMCHCANSSSVAATQERRDKAEQTSSNTFKGAGGLWALGNPPKQGDLLSPVLQGQATWAEASPGPRGKPGPSSVQPGRAVLRKQQEPTGIPSAPCKGLQFPGPPLLPGFPSHPCCQALTTSQPCSHRTLCPESSSMTDLLRSLGRHHLLQEALCDHEPLSSFSSTDQNWTLCSVTPLPCHQDGAPGGVSTAPMALP